MTKKCFDDQPHPAQRAAPRRQRPRNEIPERPGEQHDYNQQGDAVGHSGGQ